MGLGFAVSAAAILVDSLRMLVGMAALGGICLVLAGPSRSQIRLTIISLGLMVWALMVSQGLFYQRHPRHALVVVLEPNWFFEDGLKIYAEGLRYGLIQSLRLVAVGCTSYAICFSSSPPQLVEGLLWLRVPFSLTFMAASALRFLPITANEFRTVRRAMYLKGYRPFRHGIWDTIRTEVASLRPVLAGAIRRSQEVAMAILVRGFSLEMPRSQFRREAMRTGDWCILIGLLLAVTVLFLCKIVFWVYLIGVFYLPSLRPFYGFVRDWL